VSGGTVSIAGGTFAPLNVTITGGNVAGTSPLSTPNLTLSSGGLAAPFSLTGNATWSGGTMSGAATGTVTSGAVLAIGSASDHDFNARTLVNNGTVNWTDGRLRSGSGG